MIEFLRVLVIRPTKSFTSPLHCKRAALLTRDTYNKVVISQSLAKTPKSHSSLDLYVHTHTYIIYTPPLKLSQHSIPHRNYVHSSMIACTLLRWFPIQSTETAFSFGNPIERMAVQTSWLERKCFHIWSARVCARVCVCVWNPFNPFEAPLTL